MKCGPPAWILGLLRMVVPASEVDFVLGDLTEEFDRRQRAEGRARAVFWFVWEGLRTGASLVTYDRGG